MIVGTRDLFGFERLHYHPRSGKWAGGISQLLRESGESAGEPDVAAIAGYLNGERLVGRTVLHDVLAVPPGHALIQSAHGLEVQDAPSQPVRGDLETVLRESLQRALDSGKRVALALSGGLDSALLLALLRELGAQQRVTSYILATGMPDYCERDAALELANLMQAKVKIVQASEADFVAALPRTTHAVEEPMFNLHPVAKLLLAEAMAEDGIELAISGDGADQVLRRDQSANYLPLCNALFGAASVGLHPPFVDAPVVEHLISLAPDPNKQCLRDLGARLNLPDRLVHGPKRGRLAPAMNLDPLLERERIRTLAATLNLPAPTLQADTERVLWTTLTLILDHLGATSRPV
ncbi:asparagine synthase-related protein [Paraburkholderia megapolitana]|uniref:asparagine synthase-related protein n=1 Tax=Paraburkholderia megapolitana TaxID=420953 RepID=UPI0038BC643C